MEKPIDHAAIAIAMIDAELERPPISIQEAIIEAIQNGRMTEAEGKECIEAYERTFHQE